MGNGSGDGEVRVAARVRERTLERRRGEPGALKRYLAAAWHGFVRGLPVGVVMLCVSAIIGHLKPLEGFDAFVTRAINAQRTPGQDELQLGKHRELPPPVLQLEFSAEARVASLEQRDALGEIERVGGVAPIHRGEMARALASLAARLPAPANGASVRRIVAIDVDLAPLGNGATSKEDARSMQDALRALRAKAHVIAIVLPRNGSEDRAVRDAFMRQQCARYNPLPTADKATTEPKGELYFASPRLFHAPGDYPLVFPTTLKDTTAAQVQALPPWYPGLGTLTYLRAGLSGALHQRAPFEPEEAQAARRSLTWLCEQAGDTAPAALEDVPDLAGRLAFYELQPFNWRLLDSTSLQLARLPDVRLDADTLPDDAQLADSIVVSVDGGARHDKFDIAGIVSEPVAGAALHALQALSLSQTLATAEHHAPLAFVFDVGVALIFSILWALLNPALQLWRKAMPVVGGWVSAAGPAALAAGLMVFSVWVAARLLASDVWLNPAYIILGLLLDAYLEGWRQESEARGAHDESGFRFGVDTAWGALQRGFGDRVERLEVAVDTERGAVGVVTDLPRPGVGEARLLDALIAALLRVAVLAVGVVIVVVEFAKFIVGRWSW